MDDANHVDNEGFVDKTIVGDSPDSRSGAALLGGERSLEAFARCFFIIMMLALLGWLIWRPGMGRLQLVFSLFNPSRGERLAWRAENDPVPEPPPAKVQPSPSEWRLGPTHSTHWSLNRSGQPSLSRPEAGRLKGGWKRTSQNAWSWHDDTATRRNPGESLPPQKSMTTFRAGDLPAWPRIVSPLPATSPAQAFDQSFVDSLPTLPQPIASSGGFSQSGGATGLLTEIPPLPAINTGDNAQSSRELPPLPSPATVPSTDTTAAVEPIAAAQPLIGFETPEPAAVKAPTQSDGEIDWSNREITRRIEGAYLIIYPRLRFVGLCVPGQGYVRKYNQVGVPRDITEPKMNGDDGRVPYGRYYVADRYQDADGPRLFLSWPSPDDARRAGVDATQQTRIEQAWEQKTLPPQNTAAGGGVGLNGLRQWMESTDGGFALEAPHMEEIFTALPDKAWVIIER